MEGTNGDLWRLVRRTDLAVSCIRSRIPRDEVVLSGFTWEDWLGNQAADIAAGELAATLVLPPATIALRQRTLTALCTAHKVMSAVEEAVLACHHAPDHPIAKRRKRRKRLTSSQAAAHPSWTLHCTTCHKKATGSSRWRAFATSLCPLTARRNPPPAQPRASRPRALHRWVVLLSLLIGVGSSRHASAARAAYPIPVANNGAGSALPEVASAYCANVAAIAAWRAWASCPAHSPGSTLPTDLCLFGGHIGALRHSTLAMYRTFVFAAVHGALGAPRDRSSPRPARWRRQLPHSRVLPVPRCWLDAWMLRSMWRRRPGGTRPFCYIGTP